MKKTLFVVFALLSVLLSGICTSAVNDDMIKVESAREILGEDEMQKPGDFSKNASLYAYLNGKGTEEDPYEIHNAADLTTFADSINSGTGTKSYYKLMEDIDLGGKVWTPVGYHTADLEYEACFSGTFDGNGHTISNFVINSANNAYIGFFGFVYNGTVKDLTLSGVKINVSAEFTAVYVGSIAGRCIAMGEGKRVVLENCKTENASINAVSKGSVYAGGLFGYVMSSDSSDESIVRYCESGTDVFALSGADSSGVHNVYAGGLIGYTGATVNTSLTIEKCTAYGNVNATTSVYGDCVISAFAGGLCGFSGASGEESVLDINECNSVSTVYAECTSAGYAGGITSYLAQGTGSVYVADCYSACDISGMTHGTTSDTNYMIMGGIAGGAEPDIDISNCFSRITAVDAGSQDSYAGVIIGFDFKTLYGSPFGTSLKNCFYSPDCSVDAINLGMKGATEIADAVAGQPETYTGFDFLKVWKFYDEGYKYPVLRDTENYFRINYMVRGRVTDSIVARYGDDLVLPTKTPDTYTDGPNEFLFSHWSLSFDGEAVAEDTKIIDAYTVYAVFEGRYKTYSFVFMNGDTEYDRQSVIYGQTATEPAVNPVKNSDVNFWYRFKYWSTASDGSDKRPVSEIVAKDNCTFYAIYEAFDHNVWNGKDSRSFSAGAGTEMRPYEIRSGYELYHLALEVNGGNKDLAGAYYKLCADIDLAGNEWLPVGEKGNEFCGVFDGNGYTVRNMSISKGDITGIFGFVSDAEITNLVIDNATIDIDDAQHSVYAGVLSGYASNSIIRRIGITNSSLSVSAGGSSVGVDAGAVVGRVSSLGAGRECIISDCYSDTVINVSIETEAARAYAGQIVGRASVFGASSLIAQNCYGIGDVSAKADMAYAGGIVGNMSISDGTDETAFVIEGCFVPTGSIKAEGVTRAYAGDILGFTEDTAEMDRVYSFSGVVIEAQSQIEEGVVLVQGDTAEPGNFRNKEFLSQNLGFDFDGVWYFEDEYAYPTLKAESVEKPMFSVSDVGHFSGNVTLKTTVRVTDSKPYRVTLSVYSDRGRLIGIKSVRIQDNTESEIRELPMAVENVRDASYIKITVTDEALQGLLFPSVMKRL